MKRLVMIVTLVLVGALALSACATGTEESGTATASALQATSDAAEAAAAATAAVIQETSDAGDALATQALADAQATADAASTEAAGQPTDEAEPTEDTAAVTEEATEEQEPTEEATEAEPTEDTAAVATEEPTEEPTAEEPTAEPTVEEPTAEPTAEPTEEPTAEEPTAEPTVEEPTAEPTVEEPTAEPTEEAAPTEDTGAQATTEARQARATERAETAAAKTASAPEPTEEMTEEATVEAPEATAAAGDVTSVCLVTDLGRINDGSFNQSAYEGMVRAEADLGLDTKFIETQAQTDYEANINTCLDEGFDVIVTVGFLITADTVEAAKANPDVFFIGVDQFPPEVLPNFVGIQFREDQSGFLAGAMAALMTETGTVGGVYGVDIPPVRKFRNGFEQGARYINPDIELLGVYIPDFIAPQLGAEAAEAFVSEEEVDVVFGAGGPTGSGAIVRAAELGAWVIGVDKDEYLSTFGSGETPGADRIITSAMKRVDNGVYDMIVAAVEGALPEDSLYLMDASINGVGFAPAHDAAVPEEVTEQIQGILDMLAAGELETGVDPVTGDLLDAEMDGEATPEDDTAETPEGEDDGEEEEMEETPEATATP